METEHKMNTEPEKEGNHGNSKYSADMDDLAYNLTLLGIKDIDLAKHLEINESTLYRWKNENETFRKAIKSAKEQADGEVVKALFERAKGYLAKEDKLSKDGDIHELRKHIPADTTAMIFWLKNRHPEKWRDKQEVDHQVDVNVNVVSYKDPKCLNNKRDTPHVVDTTAQVMEEKPSNTQPVDMQGVKDNAGEDKS